MDDLRKLGDNEINNALKGLQGWVNEGTSVSKTFTFDSFPEAADFVAAIGELSDDMEGHHPHAVVIRGTVVQLRLATPSVQGVSESDIDLAQACDEIAVSAVASGGSALWDEDDEDESDLDEDEDDDDVGHELDFDD